MLNETIRIFFPLKIATYPQDECRPGDNPEEIIFSEAVKYEDAILVAIAGENRHFENGRGRNYSVKPERELKNSSPGLRIR